LLEGTTDVLFAVDGRGVIVGSSKPAFDRLRRDGDLPSRIHAAVRASGRRPSVVRDGARALHVSPCGERGVAWLIAVDGEEWIDAPVRVTARQRELLALVDKGLTNAEIAAALAIAAPTVKTMLERLYRKAGVSNRVELLAWSRAISKRVVERSAPADDVVSRRKSKDRARRRAY